MCFFWSSLPKGCDFTCKQISYMVFNRSLRAPQRCEGFMLRHFVEAVCRQMAALVPHGGSGGTPSISPQEHDSPLLIRESEIIPCSRKLRCAGSFVLFCIPVIMFVRILFYWLNLANTLVAFMILSLLFCISWSSRWFLASFFKHTNYTDGEACWPVWSCWHT